MSQEPDLIVLEQQPFNAAPPIKLLKQTFVTSHKHFYVRNHGSVPAIDSANYRLSIVGQVRRSLSVVVAGYAIAGGDHQVEKVELSQNVGKTWVETFLEEPSPWRWRFWQHRLDLQPDTTELIVRAWDSAGNTQPEDINTILNFKGYMNNAWHRVTIKRFDAEI